MANPHKGEVEFDLAGKKYLLSFSANAVAELEEALDKSVDEIGALLRDAAKVRLAHWRTMFTIALQDNHDDIDEKAAKALFKKLSLADAIQLTGKAYGLAFNGLADLAAGAAQASPPAPGQSAPTGPDSSTPGANSARTKASSGG